MAVPMYKVRAGEKGELSVVVVVVVDAAAALPAAIAGSGS
jgi:hypothetical protein